MGNSESIMGVNLDTPVVMAGGIVQGSVCLKLKNNIDKCDNLTVYLIGTEYTRVVYHTGSGKHRKRHVERRQNEFLKANICLCNKFNNNEILAGTYEYPFSFQLPIDIPSTMQITGKLFSYQLS